MGTSIDASSDKSSGVASLGEDADRMKRMNIFLDVNPQTNCLTIFDRGLMGSDTRVKVISNKQTPQAVIDRELAMNVLDGVPTVKSGEHFKIIGDCIKIMPRANPRGTVKLCEMCPRHAHLRCANCLVTYYCGWGHRHMDSTHSMLCYKLKIIRWPSQHRMDATSRYRIQAQKLAVKETLLESLVYQAISNLYSRKLPLALSLLHQSLRYVKDVYGKDNQALQLITIYTTITEVHLSMGKISAAEKSLSAAWTTLWSTEENIGLGDRRPKYAHAQVNKTQGLVAYATGNTEEAMYHFSECIYCISEIFCPTHIRACVGYYNLARCFYAQSRKADGLSMSSFCLKLWLDFLGDVLTSTTQDKNVLESIQSDRLISFYLEMEAMEQLSGLQTYFNEESHPKEYLRTRLCIGIIHFVNKKFGEAHACVRGYKIKDEREVEATFKLLKKLAARRELHG